MSFLLAALLTVPMHRTLQTSAFASAKGDELYTIQSTPFGNGGVFVRRLSLEGGVIWENSWTENRGEVPIDAAVTGRGGIAVVGNQDQACFAVYWSSAGQKLWSTRLSYDGNCRIKAVLAASSGHLYVLGTTGFRGFFGATVWKLNARGDVLWMYRQDASPSRWATAFSLSPFSETLMVATASRSPGDPADASFLLNADGGVIQ